MSKKKVKAIAGNSLITKFFNKQTDVSVDNFCSSSIIETAQSPKATDFYESCVIEKLADCVPCSVEQLELKSKLVDAKQKLSEAQKAIDFCLNIGRYKDGKIKELRDKIQLASSDKTIRSNPIASKDFSSKFEDKFTKQQSAELHSVKSAESGDSTFVLKGVRFMYGPNLTILENKTVAGRAKNKTPITPEKFNMLKSMFDERLYAIGIDYTEQQKRAKRFKLHLNRAIINANSSQKRNVDHQILKKINNNYSETENMK